MSMNMRNDNDVKKWWYRKLAEKIIPILTKSGYTVFQADSITEAKNKIIELIPEGASITMDSSVVLDQMGLVEIFRSSKYNLFDRFRDIPFIPDKVEILRQGMTADYLVSGCNAITENGELVNRDCTGNRVAGMIFGPKKVIIVAGVNKIVKDIPAALSRIKEITPMYVRRIGTHITGCVETSCCTDCDLPGRVCNYTTIIHNGRKFPGRITIIIVTDEIGF